MASRTAFGVDLDGGWKGSATADAGESGNDGSALRRAPFGLMALWRWSTFGSLRHVCYKLAKLLAGHRFSSPQRRSIASRFKQAIVPLSMPNVH